jgi:anti-sigma B factor antagonist
VVPEQSPNPHAEAATWSEAGALLRVRRHVLDEHSLVVTVEGELDLRGAPILERALERDLPEYTVLDLGGVTFLAAAGLGVLAGAVARAEREHRRIAVIAGTRPVLRVLRLFADDVRVPIHGDQAEAVQDRTRCLSS